MCPSLIDPVQSGFVKGRRIADNIFLTQEIMQGYHRSSSSSKCAMKVDIMKAYDNVRWDFLWDTLTCMNFHPKMITWLKACVTTASYTLNINGEPTGTIKGERGLRQGDPLSSYLFVIVMEVLTCILKEKSKKPDFRFHWRCNQTKIINLCFADDLMLFCNGDVKSVRHIHDSLCEFESLSGLSPSPGKSTVFFYGVQHNTRKEILQLLGFNEGTLPVRYLGVPLLSTKLKHVDCKPMIDKITARTKTWTNRDLTYAGRVQLIKNVLFSMQTYWSSLFILPKKVIKEVETILRSFLWSGPDLKEDWGKSCLGALMLPQGGRWIRL
jgi:mannosylglycoprotein endo-beta-mannosidase